MSTDIRQLAAELWDSWTAMWNGDRARGLRLLDDGFRVWFGSPTAAADGADDLLGAQATVDYITAFRARYRFLRYRTEFGPLVDITVVDGVPEGHLACRWIADATDADGTERSVAGHDILAVRGDRVTRAWSVTGVRNLLA